MDTSIHTSGPAAAAATKAPRAPRNRLNPEELAAQVNRSRVVRTAGVDRSSARVPLPDPAIIRGVTSKDGRVEVESLSAFRMNAWRWSALVAAFVLGTGVGCVLMKII
jgi:hypothetical protein